MNNERLLKAYQLAIEISPCPHDRIIELFNAHNEAWPNLRESSTMCAGCVQRVYRRVSHHLSSQGLI